MAQETTKQSLILCVGEKCSSKFPGLVFSSIGNTVSVSFFLNPRGRYFANRSSRSDKLFFRLISSFFGARWRKIILAILVILAILAILDISATLAILAILAS